MRVNSNLVLATSFLFAGKKPGKLLFSKTDADILLAVAFGSGIFTTSLRIFPIPMGRLFNRRLPD